ncbi:MAG TPA: 30S ribosomal protein S2 [Candidatus Paceibacterota bacterium]|nr:30S ribosomal protein S2 [Candidatus Paceibacterota bacterium]
MPKKKKEETEAEKTDVVQKVKKVKKTKKVEEIVEEDISKSDETDKKKRTSDRSVLLKELKEKAKKLAEKIETVDTGEIKEELEKKREMLVPLEDYVKTGIHLGTRVITPDMKKFVYRRRADSIGVLNTTLIDEQIKKAIEFISKYNPEEIILVCKREAGWKVAHLFSEVTGINVFTKKYPAGMMTNIQLEKFYEPELIIICDPWIDKNALKDAISTNKKVIGLADTNNFLKNLDLVIPCNNKGSKSLGIVFYLLAKGYLEKRKIKGKMPLMEDFTEEE